MRLIKVHLRDQAKQVFPQMNADSETQINADLAELYVNFCTESGSDLVPRKSAILFCEICGIRIFRFTELKLLPCKPAGPAFLPLHAPRLAAGNFGGSP
jgi:hypothetical protein